MISFFCPQHALHAPEYEFFLGERVMCFESPSRAQFVLDELNKRGHEVRTPTTDSLATLRRVHAQRYLAFLESAWSEWTAIEPGNAKVQPFPSVWPVRTLRSDLEPINYTAKLGLYSMDNGCALTEGTWSAAKAGADFMGGYCFVNNAAVAAQDLVDGGCPLVAILDIDYHHGNGTQSIFYQRADVLVANIHGDPRTEYPFYLGYPDEVGDAAGSGFNLNLPLPAGTTARKWFEALEVASARIVRHRPGALVVSLGLDTFVDDPICKFSLGSDDFSRIGERIRKMGLPTIFVLEGGYAAAELRVNAVNVLDGFENA